MERRIAIDFGTERTKLAYLDHHRNKVRIMRLGLDERPFIPSLIYLSTKGKKLFGDDARDMLEEDPAGIVDVLKRRLRDRSIRRNGQKVAPVELLADLLRLLLDRVKSEIPGYSSGEFDQVTVTIPARYGPADKDIMIRASKEAGFGEVILLAEPLAAAHAWLREHEEIEKDVIVFDCGGGTVDWAFLRWDGEDFAVDPECPPGGDQKIGGHDIDEELLNVLLDELDDDAIIIDEIEDHKSFYLEKLRQVKERYCRHGSILQIHVAGRKISLNENDIVSTLRERFIDQAWQGLRPYLENVRERLNGKAPAVLLVGGSSRISGLREKIEESSGCRVEWWERSEYATVLGGIQLNVTQKEQTNTASRQSTSDTKSREPADPSLFESFKESYNHYINYLSQMSLLRSLVPLEILLATALEEKLKGIRIANPEKRFPDLLATAWSIGEVDLDSIPENTSQFIEKWMSRELESLLIEIAHDLNNNFIPGFTREKIISASHAASSYIKDNISFTLEANIIHSEMHEIRSLLPSIDSTAKQAGKAFGGGAAGAIIGQIAIPIPVVGAMIGGAIGGILGGKSKMYPEISKSIYKIITGFNRIMHHIDSNYKGNINDMSSLISSAWDMNSLFLSALNNDNIVAITSRVRDRSTTLLTSTLYDDSSVYNPSLSECINLMNECVKHSEEVIETALTEKSFNLGYNAILREPRRKNVKKLYVYPDIPSDLLETVMLHYGCFIDPQGILCIHDSSWYSHKDGFLLTPREIRWHNAFEDCNNFIKLDDIKSVRTKKDNNDAIFVNGDKIVVDVNRDRSSLAALTSIIRSVKKACVK